MNPVTPLTSDPLPHSASDPVLPGAVQAELPRRTRQQQPETPSSLERRSRGSRRVRSLRIISGPRGSPQARSPAVAALSWGRCVQ